MPVQSLNAVRIAISLFLMLLITVSVVGWVWTGSHQPPAQAIASRTVLTIGVIAGVAAIVSIWRVHAART